MHGRAGCEQTRALAAELALGIADGMERADALDHLSSCSECRKQLTELTDIADELLALTPSHEPPVGFETRVAAAIDEAAAPAPANGERGRRPRRRRLHLALAAGAALAAAAATAAGLLLAFQDDRQLAGQYRAALERVGGEYFQAGRLYDDAGTPVGKVFGYQGRPSWLLVLVYEDYRTGPFTASLVTSSGVTVPLPSFDVGRARESWGGAIPIDLRDVRIVRLEGTDGVVYQGTLPAGPTE